MSTTVHPAHGAVDRGLHVFPLREGTKAGQLVGSWAKEATADRHQLDVWLRHHPAMNYGIHAGRSGLIVLDADGVAAVDAVEAWATEEHWREQLDSTLAVVTPGHGIHWYFRDIDPPTRAQPGGGRANPITEAGERLERVDWRSANGYVVGPGSTRTDKGGAEYRIVNPTGWTTPILDAPDALLAACRRVHAHRSLHTEHRPSSPQWAGDGPWTDYENSRTPEDVFTEHGWTQVRVGNPGERSRWRRPGAESASSAAVYADTGGITIFSSNAGLADEHYSGAAALKCAFLYPGLRVDEAKERFTEWLRDNNRPARPPARTAEHTTLDDEQSRLDEDAWPEPTLIFPDITPPDFPVDVLPAELHDAAATITEALELDIDLGALIGIGCLSAVATWNDIRLDLNDTRQTGPNIYQAISLPPSAGKSPVFKAMTSQLEKIARREKELSQTKARDAETRRRIADKRTANAEAAAVKDRNLEGAALLALTEAERIEIPAIRRLIADDITPEALGELLADNGGHLAVVSAEGDFFDGLGRYAERGREANISAPLKAWSGDTIIVNRVGGREYEVADPRITMTLTVQPSVVKALWANPQFAGRGLVHRVMVAQPPHRVGQRTYDAAPADGDVLAVWADLLDGLHRRLQRGRRYRLHPDAYVELRRWQRQNEPRLLDEWAEIVSSVSKIEDTAVRVALLLHLAEQPDVETVGVDTLRRGIEVGRYWIGQLLAIQPQSHIDPLRRVLEWAVTSELTEFTVRDLLRAGPLKRMVGPQREDVVPVLAELVAHRWLIPEAGDWAESRPGKRSASLRVHPEAERALSDSARLVRQVDRAGYSVTTENGQPVGQSDMSTKGAASSPPPPPTPLLPTPPPEPVRQVDRLPKPPATTTHSGQPLPPIESLLDDIGDTP